jgi:hypothetical protein
MPKYMLLLHDDPSAFATVSPAQMQAIIEKYAAWGAKLQSAGVLVGGHKLTDEPGRVMRGRNGSVRVTDGPYSETKEVLGGFYTIEAASYDQAVATARDCPHFEYGGAIEIRQIDEMPGH